ncbi:feruloyl-CoA synthase [Peribacillus deserti]|uniref:Feruloyl-CoA synthase n=1 Tax=Peribacillus deserti TaxID=673318 RepID=A0ABS2QHV3_9BACI|nr:long-chain-fatty-acid--CoA ligase [Peribacillus deserti]MBM7692750.1 feruloyl-CoA synthase [Peribacillus deserti]
MNSSELLARNSRKYPEAEAVIGMGKRYSYRKLDSLVNQFGHALLKRGIDKGDKVVLFMPNVPEFVIAYFAIQRIGAIVVPINAKLAQPEVEYILDHSDARALIVHHLLFESVKGIHVPLLMIKTGEPESVWESFENILQEGDAAPIECTLTEDDESTILYTSGTTGRPKGVLFHYRSILTVAQMICVEMEMKPESRLLLMMPLSHSAPLHLFLMAGIVTGSSLVLTPTFTPELLLNSVEQEKTTHFFGAPVAYLLTANDPQIKQTDLSSMKWWVYGGAPLSSGEVKFVQESFQTDNLVCVYGLTEAGPSGTLLPGKEHEGKAGSIGRRAALHTEIKIVNDRGEAVQPGEVGEILLRGEGNMARYHKDEEATKKAFSGDWLLTGDLAKVDDEGYIWVVDRKKDLIISGGVNIYPKEIEEVLLSYPSIQEAAVVGVPHKEWGETVKAYFSAKEEVDMEELKAFLTENLASFKIPRLYEQVDMLPRNASGKILKQPLRDRGDK